MLLVSDHPTIEDFAAATGWRIEPEGACRGDVCIPLATDVATDGTVNLTAVADRLGMGIVQDDESGLIAVGPAAPGGRALTTVAAPELELPDFDGNTFRLSSLHGTKVVMVAWAPY